MPRFFIPDLHLNVSSFRVVTILHPFCGLMSCNAVMSDETLCSLFLSWFPVEVTSQAPLAHHQIGNSVVKYATYAVMSKGSFATICNLHANHFGNCLCKERGFRTENSSLPVNCNCVSLWINESQSYTWLLKSRTFLQWPTLLGHLFPTTNLFLSSLSTTCNNITQKI